MNELDFPIAQLLGFEISAVSPGVAMGHAFRAGLAPSESFTTAELKVNFLRPVRLDRLRASARVLERG